VYFEQETFKMRPKHILSRRQFLKTTGAGSAAAIAAAYGLAGGSVLAQGNPPPSDASGNLVIYNFGGEAQQAVYTEAIARFNQRYPNVVVEDLYTPFPDGWGQYITQLQVRVASGLPIDIIAIAIEGVQATIQQDLVLPIDDLIAQEPVFTQLVEQVEPSLHNALKGADGTTYYLTREWNNMIIHYNTQMFEDAGLEPPAADWTWEDFLETALTLTSGQGGDKVFGFAIPFFNFGLAPWFHTNSTSTLTDDWSDSNLDDPKVLESVKFIHSLVNEHGVSPDAEGTAPFELFSAGRAAMTGGGRWPFAGYIANDFRTVDITPWPRNTAGTTVFGSGGWAISKSTRSYDLAVELLKDLNDLETEQGLVRVGTSLPSRQAATELPEFQDFPASSHWYFDSLQDIKPIPSPPNFAEVESIFMRHMSSIMTNAVTPEQGMEQAHAELSAAMAEMRGE
jgi:multiple sugar transport system substrate-binding protein